MYNECSSYYSVEKGSIFMSEENITRLTVDDKEIILIGTAHVSRKSAELVEKVIQEEQPDSVCVELDQKRSEEHTSELQSRGHLVCRLLLEKKNTTKHTTMFTS